VGSPECACVSRTKNPHFLAPASRILSLSGASRVSLSPRLARKIESTQRLKNLKPCAQQPKPAAARLRACPSNPCWRGNSWRARQRTRLWCPVGEKKSQNRRCLQRGKGDARKDKHTFAQAPSPFSTTSVMAHLPASAPLSTLSITIFGVKVVATLKILKLLLRSFRRVSFVGSCR